MGTIILKPVTKQELCFVQGLRWSVCHTNAEFYRLGIAGQGK